MLGKIGAELVERDRGVRGAFSGRSPDLGRYAKFASLFRTIGFQNALFPPQPQGTTDRVAPQGGIFWRF